MKSAFESLVPRKNSPSYVGCTAASMLPREVKAWTSSVELTGAEGKVSPMRALAVDAMMLKLPVLFLDQSEAVRVFRATTYLKEMNKTRVDDGNGDILTRSCLPEWR